MYKYLHRTFLLLIVVLNAQVGRSQIVVTPSAGCIPLSVQFSAPSGATNCYWNLGPAGTTTLSNPNPLFTSAGNFNITFTAMVNGSPVTYTALVKAGSPPTGTFGYQLPASHCVPLTATFTASGGSPGSTIDWAFGDFSAIASGTSVTHTYQFSNSFIPVAIITDAVSGCTATATGGGTIHVSNLPMLNITSSNGLIGCVPPFVTTFNSAGSISGSPLGGSLTISWQMPTGNPASVTGPAAGPVTFGQGSHNVIISGTDNNQCAGTTTVVVSVVNPTVTLAVTPTVCVGAQTHFTVTSPQNQVNLSVTTLGNSSSTLQANVTTTVGPYIFNIPGLQTVVASVQAAGVCPTFTVLKTVMVESVTSSFTGQGPFTSCNPTMLATYVNSSTVNTGATLSYSWWPSWGYNSSWQATPTLIATSSTNNVTFTLSQGSNNPYTIYNLFQPVITLFVLSSNGCSGSSIGTFHTQSRINARFNKLPREGCVPLTVDLRDTSYTSINYPITTYSWNSNGGTPVAVTNSQIVAFTYTAPGYYVPSLTVTTANGCIDVFRDTVYVGAPPTLTATFPASVCAGVPVTISMTGSSTGGPVNHWHVTTDEGMFSGCITDQSPSYPFTHPGIHTVAVTGYNYGCANTTTLSSTINVSGPFGQFVFSTHCTGDKKAVDFEVHLEDATGAVLNYGDNTSPVNIIGNPGTDTYTLCNHVYPASGDYTVSLVTSKTGGNCAPVTFTRVVHIRQPVARITWGPNNAQIPALPQALSCVKSRYQFRANTSTENVTYSQMGYRWWFAGPNHVAPPIDCIHPLFSPHFHPGPIPEFADLFYMDTFRVAGIYTITLRVTDINGCTAFDTKIFRISNAVPDFTFASNPLCLSAGPAQIINNTQNNQVVPDVIKSYTFTYGDGTQDTSSIATFSPAHQYSMVPPPSYVFTVMAVAKNQLGCIDTTKHTLTVNNPATGFYSPSPFACIPKGQLSNGVPFQAMPGYATYSFSTGSPPGNPVWQTSSTFSNIVRTYNLPGVYFPTLTVIDAAGCKATDQVTISAVGQPTAYISNPGRSGFCVPAKITLQDSSASYITPISGYQWSSGTITQPVGTQSVYSNIFPAPGSYTVSLTAYAGDVPSCPHTASRTLYVFDTKAKIEIDKFAFCLGEEFKARVFDTKDVYSWKWFFGDLVPQPTIYNTPFTQNPFTYKYDSYPASSPSGLAIIVLKAISDFYEGCVVTQTAVVQLIRIDTDFKEENDNYRHCLSSKPDKFINTTPNPLRLTFNPVWSFGDGKTYTMDPVTHLFDKAGTYTVQLKLTDDSYGCKGSAVKTITVLPLPRAGIQLSDSLVCPGDTFNVRLSGTSDFQGIVRGSLQPTTHTLFPLPPGGTITFPLTTSISTTYMFNVRDTNNCASPDTSVQVRVPLKAPEVHKDTTVVIGQTVALSAGVPGNYSYHWYPERMDLSDSLSPNPVSTSMVDVLYSVFIIDEPKQCWLSKSTYSIHILPYSSLDMPQAFTPNGDGTNDLIFPDGWGVKKLLYFRVYNRWGQIVFETNEYRQGWDGRYQGVPQNMDTYVWQAEIETYIDDPKTIVRSGTFKLIR